MPYASDRDRNPHDLELTDPAFPVAPLNFFLTSGYTPGVFDLCWDNPASLSANSKFEVYGVNIYRSFDSELGPYERLTEFPLGSTFYRDLTDNVLALEETVEDGQWLLRGDCTGDDRTPRYVFKTLRPIVISGSQALPETNTDSVKVTIDGIPARIRRVVGHTGEVELETIKFPDVATQKLDPSPIPGDNSVVKVTYRYNRFLLKTDLGTRIFYRATTVGIPIPSTLNPSQDYTPLETPLERAVLTSSREIEKTDWIWGEAVRRNRWILQQGGERVKVFIQKTVGEPCDCVHFTHKQPLNDCADCFGVGIRGGFEGPYDITVAPDDGPRSIQQTEKGRHQEHTYDVWTGPSPLLSQRDFIVKINGERYALGPVHMPSNRGMLLQQHFSIGVIDEQDIRYKVPLDGVPSVMEVRQLVPPQLRPAEITEKTNIPDERELKGRTKTWGNITY